MYLSESIIQLCKSHVNAIRFLQTLRQRPHFWFNSMPFIGDLIFKLLILFCEPFIRNIHF